MAGVKWRSYASVDLLQHRDSGALGSLIPSLPGIYIWRRAFNIADAEELSADEFVKWVVGQCSRPVAKVSRVSLSHCLTSHGLSIGGGELPPDKLNALELVATDHRMRNVVLGYIAQLSAFAPPIYVGQTDDLNERLRSHLDGQTGLEIYVTGSLGLTLADLRVDFVQTGTSRDGSQNAIRNRQLLETIAQRVLAPFAVQRIG
jgi:hypothetical protein